MPLKPLAGCRRDRGLICKPDGQSIGYRRLAQVSELAVFHHCRVSKPAIGLHQAIRCQLPSLLIPGPQFEHVGRNQSQRVIQDRTDHRIHVKACSDRATEFADNAKKR